MQNQSSIGTAAAAACGSLGGDYTPQPPTRIKTRTFVFGSRGGVGLGCDRGVKGGAAKLVSHWPHNPFGEDLAPPGTKVRSEHSEPGFGLGGGDKFGNRVALSFESSTLGDYVVKHKFSFSLVICRKPSGLRFPTPLGPPVAFRP